MASRTASMRETAYRVCSWSSSKCPVPNGSIFSARYPRSTTPCAALWYASGVRSVVYQPLAYALTLSVTLPPSSCQTGTPRALPLMSQHAISMTAMPDITISPARP